MSQVYKKPPITEASIEVRFAEAMPVERVELAAKRLGKRFARTIANKDVRIAIDLEKDAVDLKTLPDGFKLISKDGADVLFVRPIGMAQSRLAPYCGWESLREKTQTSWEAFSKIAGKRRIQRVSLRYINRIDIPTPPGEYVPLEEYLRVHAQVPPMGLLIDHFTLQLQTTLPALNLTMIVNSGTAPPALVDHYAALLDIEIGCETLGDTNEEGLWSKLEEMRNAKNAAFEELITEKARALFQ